MLHVLLDVLHFGGLEFQNLALNKQMSTSCFIAVSGPCPVAQHPRG